MWANSIKRGVAEEDEDGWMDETEEGGRVKEEG